MTAVLETTGYRAPLALHALDAATGADVADGLVAVAWPQGDPASARTAVRSPVSALLGFGTLPGLRSQELASAAGGGTPGWPAPNPQPFVVTVTDTLGRYLPEAMAIQAPQTAPQKVTLYSAPARPRPPGWATVSGEVAVSTGPAPAAWALIEVDSGTDIYQTVCDQAGRFLLYLPYPEALPALAGSPSAGTGIGAVSWPLAVTVYCQPAALTWPASPAPAGPPDISSIGAQHQAEIVTAGGTQWIYDATLSFGTPLRLLLDMVPA
jgi:hypothetical protein